MHLDISSHTQKIFQGEISQITLPCASGRFQILKGHAPIVASLSEGKINYTATTGQTHLLPITSGFLYAADGEIKLLVTPAERTPSIQEMEQAANAST